MKLRGKHIIITIVIIIVIGLFLSASGFLGNLSLAPYISQPDPGGYVFQCGEPLHFDLDSCLDCCAFGQEECQEYPEETEESCDLKATQCVVDCAEEEEERSRETNECLESIGPPPTCGIDLTDCCDCEEYCFGDGERDELLSQSKKEEGIRDFYKLASQERSEEEPDLHDCLTDCAEECKEDWIISFCNCFPRHAYSASQGKCVKY